jgi:hypothetical protein
MIAHLSHQQTANGVPVLDGVPLNTVHCPEKLTVPTDEERETAREAGEILAGPARFG